MSDEFFEKLGTALKQRVVKPRDPFDDDDEIYLDNDGSILNTHQSSTQRVWTVADDVYMEGRPTTRKVPAGLYQVIQVPQYGVGLKKQPINTDELIIPPDDSLKRILSEFQLFWESKEKFQERGLLYKRGFLMWGPPGGGKTCIISLMNKILVNDYNGIIVIVDHPVLAATMIKVIRKIEPERPLILIIEDLDALIERYGENEFLSLLDGEDQIENVVSIATTNYPERLDSRFINRPSRFDKVIKLPMPNAATRRAYLQHKEKSLTEAELENWVERTDQFSLAHLKEMIVAIKCLNQPIEEVIERLSHMKHKPKSTSSESSIGFH